MGDIGEDDPQGIDLEDCATLLDQPRLLLWIRSKAGKFASPAGTKNSRPIWHEDDVYRWAAITHPQLIRRLPIRCWPDAERPATYHGAQEIEDAVAQTWRTDAGMVCVLWSRPGLTGLSLRRVAAQLPYADALIHVQSAEWSARLEPIERTAAFASIDFDGQHETLTDPETGAPVVRQANELLLAAIPQRLATFSPLAEVILDSPVWVRTKDGTLYPAPKDKYYGLSWGSYAGSGQGSLALLISRLLYDINARGADRVAGAPDGLEKLTQIDWSPGTVLTRTQMEAARDDRPYAEE